MARAVPEINAGSMADIAFLLLIFFLVTTTMDVDTGIVRKLPPYQPDTEEKGPEINERNVFVVLVNSSDQLLVEGNIGSIATLREDTKEFLRNAYNNKDLSDQKYTSEALEIAKAENDEKLVEKLEYALDIFGDYRMSKGVISLQNDRGTSYGTYIKVQNELASAINELRDELCQSKLGVTYDKLVSEGDQQKLDAIKELIPMQISEAEPKDIGGK